MKRLYVILTILGCIFFTGSVAGALSYSGMVVNDIGRPAASATVTIENLADSAMKFTVVTDTTGTFQFELSPSRVAESSSMPFGLYGNFPNPFNPRTRISYSIGSSSEVHFDIYNIVGQHVRTMSDGYREPGFYTVFWDGTDDFGKPCSAGVYLYRMIAGSRSLSSKMLMMDSATASWIPKKSIPAGVYKNSEDILYLVTVTHPDAETLVVGPMTIVDGAYDVLTVIRFMDKMQLVHKNTYTRGSIWYHYTRPLHQVKITRDFYMDKYETTAELFSKVMNHALGRGALRIDSLEVHNTEGNEQLLFKLDTPEKTTNIGIVYQDGIFKMKEGHERLPMSYVTWYGAVFYCNERSLIDGYRQCYDLTDWSCDFDAPGYRLPTDAEWELAGAWTDGREYAYGPDPGNWYPMNTQLNADGFDDVMSPVGWFSPQGDSHDGVSDMSGNVYEWVWDWQQYYQESWADSLLVDPLGPDSGINKTAKGGSAFGCFRAGRVADKANIPLARASGEIGFRTIRLAEGYKD
ncbi:SUMF1/EgtB/PvdO family nonheme iron enzyme [bacterium]|nr:SUMF1/EgtB/PvdO family nonheme iron enzyme [bacterium]